ncbi:MAG: TolC family protein [Deltaproteobacteria bacterium]|nr:TolC family protein [Deltaproteobacteria bacterium]MCB9487363.1 TolC family protein [Deltaproteobacteria bacterium]
MHRLFLSLCLGIALALAGFGPAGAESLTLEQAQQKAMVANRSLLQAQARERASVYGVTEAVGHILPTVTVSEIYLRSNDPVTAFGTDLAQGTFSLQEFSQSDPNEPDIAEDYITRIEGTQPIFTGGKVLTGLYQASENRKAAVAGLSAAEIDTLGAVEEAYVNALRARAFVDFTTQLIAALERHARTAQDQFDTGRVLESEVLQAQVHLGKARVGQVEAQSQYELALARLNYLIGEAQDRPWELSDPTAAECSMPSLDDMIGRALTEHPQLIAADHRTNAAKARTVMAATSFVPTLGVQATYNFHDEEDLFGDQAEDWTVMVAARWNIFNGFKDVSRTAAARRNAAAAELALDDHREQFALGVRQNYRALSTSAQKLNVADAARERAERHRTIMSNRYEQGLVPIATLLDAQTDLVEATTNALNARYDHILAERMLLHSVGARTCADLADTTETKGE